MSVTDRISEPMWHALGFLSTVDRWRRSEHAKIAKYPTMKGLWARGFADMYANFSEAWIEPDGLGYLADNLVSIAVQYSLVLKDDKAPGKWRKVTLLEPSAVWNRLGMVDMMQTAREQIQARVVHDVEIRLVFLRKPEES